MLNDMKCPSLAIAPSSDAQTLVKVGGQKVGEQCAAEETIEDAAARIVARYFDAPLYNLST